MYTPDLAWPRNALMRTTVTLDDELIESAAAAIGISERSVVLREGLTALIEREAARRLARLGGSDPGAAAAPRRRPAPTSGRRRTAA